MPQPPGPNPGQPEPDETKPKPRKPKPTPKAKAKADVCSDAKLINADTAGQVLDNWLAALERDAGVSRKLCVKLTGLECADQCMTQLKVAGDGLELLWQVMLEMSRNSKQLDGTRDINVQQLREHITKGTKHVMDFIKYAKIANQMLKGIEDTPKDSKKRKKNAKEKVDTVDE